MFFGHVTIRVKPSEGIKTNIIMFSGNMQYTVDIDMCSNLQWHDYVG